MGSSCTWERREGHEHEHEKEKDERETKTNMRKGGKQQRMRVGQNALFFASEWSARGANERDGANVGQGRMGNDGGAWRGQAVSKTDETPKNPEKKENENETKRNGKQNEKATKREEEKKKKKRRTKGLKVAHCEPSPCMCGGQRDRRLIEECEHVFQAFWQSIVTRLFLSVVVSRIKFG
jgi:hypothetical protein